MFWQLRFGSGFPVRRVEEYEPPVFATAGDDGPVLEDADGKDGPVVDFSQRFGDGVEPAAPDEHVAVGVAGQHVAGEAERQARHILRLVALVKQT